MATPLPTNAATFTLQEVAHAVEGTLSGDPGLRTQGVFTDSRSLTTGGLFVALRGPNFDGHGFLDTVARAGGAAAVVESDAPSALPFVRVRNTLEALGMLAAHHRGRWSGTIVAVTGSVGKTSTKELIASGLAATGAKAHRTEGNLNNRVGVPHTLFGLDDSARYGVVEIGASVPGEVEALGRTAAPDVAVVTRIAPAHVEGFGSLEAIAREKASLLGTLPAEGTAVYFGDDPLLRRWASAQSASAVRTFGFAESSDVRIEDYDLDETLGTRVRYRLAKRSRPLDVRLRLLGGAAALNGAAAIAVATVVCPDRLDAFAAGLSSVKPSPGRMHPWPGPRGSLVLDDSYNASPEAVRSALEAAAELARIRHGRLFAALGDMKELGETSHKAHAAIGRLAAELGARALIACGPEAVAAATAASEAGVTSHRVSDPAEAADVLESLLASGDVLLIKGSRSMCMERLVERLTGTTVDLKPATNAPRGGSLP